MRASAPLALTTFNAYLERFNAGDVAGLAELYARNTDVRNPFSTEPLTTPAEVEQFVGSMFSAYADLHAEPVDPIVAGSRLATVLMITARHTADLRTPDGSIAATGRLVRLRTAEFLRVDTEGSIIEHERLFDGEAVRRQLQQET